MVRLTSVVCAVLLAACGAHSPPGTDDGGTGGGSGMAGGGAGGGGSGGGGGVDAGPTGVGPSGGTVTGPQGASLVVPAGALDASVNISLTDTDGHEPGLPPQYTKVGPVMLLRPHGTTLASPAHIAIPYTVDGGSPPVLLKTVNGADGPWVELPSTTAGNLVQADLNSFSYLVAVNRRLALAVSADEWASAHVESVAVGTDGSLYVAGGITGTALEPSKTVPANTRTAFLARFDTALRLVWVKQFAWGLQANVSALTNQYSRISAAVDEGGTVCLAHPSMYQQDTSKPDDNGAALDFSATTRLRCFDGTGAQQAGFPVQLAANAKQMVPSAMLARGQLVRVLLTSSLTASVTPSTAFTSYAEVDLSGKVTRAPGTMNLGLTTPNAPLGMCLTSDALFVAAYFWSGFDVNIYGDYVVRMGGTGMPATGFPVHASTSSLARGLGCSTNAVYHDTYMWTPAGVAGTNSPATTLKGTQTVVANDVGQAFGSGTSADGLPLVDSWDYTGTERTGFPLAFSIDATTRGTVGGLALSADGAQLYLAGSLGDTFFVGRMPTQ